MPAVTLAADRRAWMRQPDETDEQWAAFSHFLASAPRREVEATAAAVGITPGRTRSMRARWRWQERCRAHDDHLADLHRVTEERQVLEMRSRHAEVGELMVAVGRAAIRRLARQVAEQAVEVTARDAASLVEAGAKLERLTRGEVTERTGHVIDWDSLSEEQLRRIAAGESPESVLSLPSVMH